MTIKRRTKKLFLFLWLVNIFFQLVINFFVYPSFFKNKGSFIEKIWLILRDFLYRDINSLFISFLYSIFLPIVIIFLLKITEK